MLLTQDGLVRHDQLTLLGVTRAGLRWRLDTGAWREVLPSVYASFGDPLSPRQRWIAACLYAGRGAALTGRVALQVHGVRSLPADPAVRVLVPHARQVRSVEFVRVHRTRRPDPGDEVAPPIRTCSLSRAVADAGRWCHDLAAIRAMVEEVVRERRVGVEALRREVEQGPTAGSGLLRLALNSL
ncbi:hypothetical protein [Planosporangium mesophilum]|uniref:AbiEi antitoxin C-terminal domain-containing protein n=1 Tax=Planosporangium mesophilum TaxID=689768 RepID=A0A8J3T783_9ACTN|nr:hypothetical protein [Planosporangium mesophilum]NJC81221.1 hypothetical protein [Planosporangium mesophilum]GII21129.1 hypothetical protein Pme01_07260 [Planosporangium mesophilum]